MKWEMTLFIILFILIFVIALIFFRKNNTKDRYDERQTLFQGKAYKYAATVMVLCSIIYYVITTIWKRSFMEDGVSALIIACIGIAVFAIYSIFTDSYFELPSRQAGAGKPIVYIFLLIIIVIGNGISAFRTIKDQEMVRNGLLTSDCVNLILAILFLLVLLSIGVKYMINRKAGQGED